MFNKYGYYDSNTLLSKGRLSNQTFRICQANMQIKNIIKCHDFNFNLATFGRTLDNPSMSSNLGESMIQSRSIKILIIIFVHPNAESAIKGYPAIG